MSIKGTGRGWRCLQAPLVLRCLSRVAADSDYRDDDVLPRRYALQPVAPTTRNPGVAGPSTSTRNRGSLPDVFAEPPAMSRQEAHLLSNWRREELRQIREEEDRRGRLSVILSVGLLRVSRVCTRVIFNPFNNNSYKAIKELKPSQRIKEIRAGLHRSCTLYVHTELFWLCTADFYAGLRPHWQAEVDRSQTVRWFVRSFVC